MDIKDMEFFNYVNNLRGVELSGLFSTEWFELHKNIVLINVYLHSNSDIIDSIEDKRMNALVMRFETLLRELITTYFIRFLNSNEKSKSNKESLSFEEKEELQNEKSNLYHELTILNIFEFILFSDYIYEKIDSCMINFFAYIYSNLVSFLKTNSEEYFVKPINELSISEILKEENDKTCNIDKLKIYMNVINNLRNITDRIHLLNNTVVNKIVDYDILLILVPLLEKRPWRHENYVFEKNEWVKTEDNTLAATEKQLWLILYTLILNRTCQEKYEMTNYRRNNILKLRKYMNESLHEQLPPMKTLHTFIEHLYISKSVFPENKNSYLIIDVVPEIFDEIKSDMLKNKKKIISLLNNITIEKDVLRNISDMYLSIYEVDQQINTKNNRNSKENDEQEKKTECNEGEEAIFDDLYLCNICKENAELQCSQCKRIYYCSKECQMKDWFNHREVCSSAE
ncbi:MYND finger protein, putative [Plasmodium malariae]|uniref:MYND finger protein, putative n=2 Tax=Plasmodium malariae TaxID=5858 RepID=A0A1D3SPJ8_PLAMA|nr:MYND finger protein, putative [Plasmodium malariae]SCO93305.1 MYND finger protein, putative [Plasmodium malariae]